MDRHNQWCSHLDLLEPAEDELTYLLQHFAESIPGYPFLLSQSRGPGFPTSSSFGAAAARDDDPTAVAGQPSSSFLFFGGGQAGTFMLSGGSGCPEQDCVVDDAVQVQQAPERRPWNAQAHVIAERRRRQKMQQQFVALATIVPDLTKVDKLSALGSTIEYVKQLEEKLKALEEQSARTTSTFFGNKCRVVPAEKNDDLLDSADIATSAGGSNSNPTVEAIVYADTVLLKICCKDKRGVLVVVLSELEKRGLSILDTSVLPFTDSCLNITIIAKVGEGFSNTGDLVNSLTKAIRGVHLEKEGNRSE